MQLKVSEMSFRKRARIENHSINKFVKTLLQSRS